MLGDRLVSIRRGRITGEILVKTCLSDVDPLGIDCRISPIERRENSLDDLDAIFRRKPLGFFYQLIGCVVTHSQIIAC